MLRGVARDDDARSGANSGGGRGEARTLILKVRIRDFRVLGLVLYGRPLRIRLDEPKQPLKVVHLQMVRPRRLLFDRGRRRHERRCRSRWRLCTQILEAAAVDGHGRGGGTAARPVLFIVQEGCIGLIDGHRAVNHAALCVIRSEVGFIPNDPPPCAGRCIVGLFRLLLLLRVCFLLRGDDANEAGLQQRLRIYPLVVPVRQKKQTDSV